MSLLVSVGGHLGWLVCCAEVSVNRDLEVALANDAVAGKHRVESLLE